MSAGATAQMTVTLYNTDTAGPQTDVSLTDNMPAGLTWTGVVSNACGGTLGASGTSLSLIGGTVPAATASGASSCTIVVNVTAPATGTYTNTIASGGATGAVNGNPTANANPATSSLTVTASVDAPVTGNKAFTPSTMALGETGSFTIRINNPNAFAISGVAFSDNLAGGGNITSTPAGGSLTPVAITDNTCGGTASIGGGAVGLSGGAIPAGSFCTVTVSFTATQAATYTNTLPAGAISVGSHPGLGNTGNIGANLAVQDSAVTMTKAFDVDEAIYPNPFILTLTFRNNTSSVISGMAVTDTFADSNGNGTPDLVVSEIAPQVTENTCGGTVTANALATGFSLSGGNIVASGACVVRIRVRSSQNGTADFTHTNTTGSCSGNVDDGNAFTCPPASDIVTLRNAGGDTMVVGLAKQYLSNNVDTGTVVRGRITLMTPESEDIVAFTMPDTFQADTTQGNPSDVVLASVGGNVTFQDCGAGATATPSAGGNGFTLANLTINARSGTYEGNSSGWPNAACVVEFDVEGDVPGTHVNTIPIDQGTGRRATDAAGTVRQGLNRQVTANFTYLSPLSAAKSFSPLVVSHGGVSRLTIRLSNSNDQAPITNLSFIDNLPSAGAGVEVLVAPAPNLTNTCGGTVTAAAGSSSVSLTGGAVLAGSVGGVAGLCEIGVDVVVTDAVDGNQDFLNRLAAGTVTGTISGADVSNNSNADAPVRVRAVNLSVGKAFSPATIDGGETSELTITIDNPNAAGWLVNGIRVTDNMPAGMEVADPANIGTTCTVDGLSGGTPATVTANAGSSNFTLANAGLYGSNGSGAPAGAMSTCTVTITVRALISDNLVNTIAVGDVTSNNGAINGNPYSATLVVLPNAAVSKRFIPDVIPVGGISELEIEVLNANSDFATSIHVQDTMPTQVSVADPLVITPMDACPGLNVGAAPGSNTITATGLNLGANERCRFRIQVTSLLPGTWTNTIASNQVGSDQGGIRTVNATDDLTVINGPTVAKSFADDSFASGETTQLTMRVTNPATGGTPLTNVVFVDNLPAGMTLGNPVNLATNGACGTGTVTATAGASVVTWSGGTLAGNAFCEITVDVTATTVGTYTNILPACDLTAAPPVAGSTAAATGNDGNSVTCNTTGAQDVVEVVVPAELSFVKALAGESITVNNIAQAGEELTYTLTINNGSPTDATAVPVIDVVPANTTFVSADNGGTLSGNQVEWTVDVAGNSQIVLSVMFRVDDPIPSGVISIANNATVNGEGCATTPCVDTPVGRPELSFNKTLSAESGSYANVVEPGEQLTYAITVQNNGTDRAVDVPVIDTLPANSTFVSADNGGTYANGLVNWTINLEPGQTVVLQVVLQVPTPLPAGVASIANNVTVDGRPCATQPCVETPVARGPTAIDDDGGVNQVGLAVTLPTPGNDQPATAPLDPTSVWIVGTSAPNVSLPVAGEGTWSVNPATGEITFTPEAGFSGNPTPIRYTIADMLGLRSNEAVESLEYTQDLLLRLSKKASVRTVVIGDLVQYTLTIENIGDIDVVDATVQDLPPNGFTLVPGSLRVLDQDNNGTLISASPVRIADVDVNRGDTATITYLMAVGAGTLPGAHTNTAVVLSNEVPISNEASATVTSTSDPLLEQSLIIGTVFNDRDGDAWQDSAKATGLQVSGGIDESVYVAGSTTVDYGQGPQPQADASAPLNHGLKLGTLDGRNTAAEAEDANRIVISQRLREARFSGGFTLLTDEGSTVRMDAAGKVSTERSGDAAKGLTAQDIRVERKVTPVDGEFRVDYVISNAGTDERGIPGVRIGTVEGFLVETDGYGRFHLEGITPSHYARGSNFVMKIDTATLPRGSTFTTENPRVKRVTPGVMARFDFGVKVPEQIIEGGEKTLEMSLGEVVFEANSAVVRPQYAPVIEHMVGEVRKHDGGEVEIAGFGGTPELALARAKAVREALLTQLPTDIGKRVQVKVRGETDGAEVLTYGSRISLGEVFFDTDKSTVKPAYASVIDKVAAEIEAGKVSELLITGHTDKRASDAYNLALGKRRAEAVYQAISRQLSPGRRATLKVEYLPTSSADAPYESARGQ
ncbi:MAG TPA: OmpA family protein [Pseudoxanthomonas sp.]